MDALPIYCINLGVATSRWERMQQRLAHYGLVASRWEASTPSTLEGYAFFNSNPKARACALSHFRLWEHCIAQGHTQVLILEDDAVFRTDWVSVVNEKLADPTWMAMFLNVSEETMPMHTWVRAIQQCLTGAYILRQPALQWLVSVFKPSLHDSDYMTMVLQANAPCITLFPWLVIQEGVESYIQSESHREADVAKVRRLLATYSYDLSNYY